MDFISWFFISILGFILFLYFWGTWTYDYWEKRNVKYIRPKYPIFGTSFDTTFSRISAVEHIQNVYNHFKGCRYGGMFSLRNPTLFVRDPELIESILIKDFAYFYNRGTAVDPKLEPLSMHLVNLRDAAWKYLRNKLTPVFSSGKLKGMYNQLVDSSNELVDYLSKYADNETFNAKTVMSKYSIDIISSCAFGLSAEGLKDESSKLVEVGQTVFKPSFSRRIRFALRRPFPWILKLLNWKGLPQETQDFFVDTIKNTIKFREEKGIVRQDFLHLMNELKKQEMNDIQMNPHVEKPIIFDDKLLTANAFVFFIAGFETTASTLSFALYELARNPEKQDKLYQEVMNSVSKHNGETTFEAIKESPYIEQVISETLRMHPPVASLPREAVKSYQIPGSDLTIPKGGMVVIPVYALHHDPEFFPNPETFLPERFSEENKNTIKKCTYLPFGDGPRICIGARFAKLEAEVALAKIILKYKIKLNEKTSVPLKYNKSAVLLSAEGGIWIDLESRK